MDERTRVLERLRELRARHEASTAEAGADALGFIQDEQVTRESYHLVASEAVRDGTFTEDELAAEGFKVLLDD